MENKQIIWSTVRFQGLCSFTVLHLNFLKSIYRFVYLNHVTSSGQISAAANSSPNLIKSYLWRPGGRTDPNNYATTADIIFCHFFKVDFSTIRLQPLKSRPFGFSKTSEIGCALTILQNAYFFGFLSYRIFSNPPPSAGKK